MNPFIEIQTHGFKVRKHINWDDLNYVAITPAGSVVIFRDKADHMLYAVYNATRGRYHVHIPYNADIFTLDEKAKKVLEEVKQCLQLAQCYVDDGVVYNVNRLRLRYGQPFGFPPWKSPL